mgnify:CR=1 FL=1
MTARLARHDLAAEPLAQECTIDDFTKIDLRVARIVAAEEVPAICRAMDRAGAAVGEADEVGRVVTLGADVRAQVFVQV